MIRSLVDEVVRRRLWPIPLAAVIIAIAAPLLFMKSAPSNAPAATASPAAATPGSLPSSAATLLATSDKTGTPRHLAKRKSEDPFAPPASAHQATTAVKAKATTTKKSSKSSSGNSTPAKPIPVIITTSNGTPAKTTTTPQTTTTPAPPATTPAATPVKAVTYVDVRFAQRQDSMIRYRVPRLQTLRADGMVVAMFVRYSQKLQAAVFAIAPSTSVAGDVQCRKVAGVCRFVDVPAGKYARLRLRAPNGSVISRRLDVVHIRHLPLASHPQASHLTTSLTAATCLIDHLLTLPAWAPSISVNACA